MQIETVPWDSLKPHQANPKNGDVDAIVQSVLRNEVYRPVITANDGTILAGHHLWYALGELRRDRVDIVRLDVDPDSARARRIMIADNRTADLGSYDDGLLVELLQQLQKDDDLLGTGFTEDDLHELLDQQHRFDEWDDRPAIEDPAPEHAGLGRAWRLGRHILICGDARDKSVWTNAPKFAACVTDPPYGIGYTGSIDIRRDEIDGDTDGKQAAALVSEVYDALPLAAGAVCYTFGSIGVDGIEVAHALKEMGLARWMLVWVKNNTNISRMDYHGKHEPIWYGWRGGTHTPVANRTSTTVIEQPRVTDKYAHPTQKPVELIHRLVANHDFPKGSWVVDPFAGSGTLMEACERQGLSAWMVDVDPSHCETILARYTALTGEEPVPL